MSGFFASGNQMHNRKNWLDTRCPRCNSNKENNELIILCPHTKAISIFRSLIKLFHQQLLKSDTHPGITEIFITYLGNRNEFTMTQCISPYNHGYNKEDYNTIRHLAKQTDLTSWYLFTSGILITGWEELQKNNTLH